MTTRSLPSNPLPPSSSYQVNLHGSVDAVRHPSRRPESSYTSDTPIELRLAHTLKRSVDEYHLRSLAKKPDTLMTALESKAPKRQKRYIFSPLSEGILGTAPSSARTLRSSTRQVPIVKQPKAETPTSSGTSGSAEQTNVTDRVDRSGHELEEALLRYKRDLEDRAKSDAAALDDALRTIEAKDEMIANLENRCRGLESKYDNLDLTFTRLGARFTEVHFKNKELEAEKVRLVRFVKQQRELGEELSDLVPRPRTTSGDSPVPILHDNTVREGGILLSRSQRERESKTDIPLADLNDLLGFATSAIRVEP